MAWLDRHRRSLEAALMPGEQLVEAAGVVAVGRRRPRSDVPRRGFVLAVTDRRLVALRASTWLARPSEEVLASWSFDEGAILAAGPFGRVRLVLPDRHVVTLSAYGGWSLRRLVRPR